MSQPHSHNAGTEERGLGDRHGEGQVAGPSGGGVQINLPSQDVTHFGDPEPAAPAVGSDDYRRLPRHLVIGDDATGDFKDRNPRH